MQPHYTLAPVWILAGIYPRKISESECHGGKTIRLQSTVTRVARKCFPRLLNARKLPVTGLVLRFCVRVKLVGVLEAITQALITVMA